MRNLKLAVYSQTSPVPGTRIVEVDGTVVNGDVIASYNHHATGERVSLDLLPVEVPPLILECADELGTGVLDADYLIFCACLKLGGRGALTPKQYAVLYAASEWCDHLESREMDPALKELGLGVFLKLKNDGYAALTRLCKDRGEMSGSRLLPSDNTMSDVANELCDALEAAIRSDNLESFQDFEYLKRRQPEQALFQENVVRNDDLVAVVVLQDGQQLDPLFAYELCRGHILVTAWHMADGSFNYRIGRKPSAEKTLTLKPLVEEMNKRDPNVLKQSHLPPEKQFRWGRSRGRVRRALHGVERPGPVGGRGHHPRQHRALHALAGQGTNAIATKGNRPPKAAGFPVPEIRIPA